MNPFQLQDATGELLHTVARAAREWGKPYLIGGDFNAEPPLIADWLRQHWGPCRPIYTKEATCNSAVGIARVLDFFLVSPILADCVKDVCVL